MTQASRRRRSGLLVGLGGGALIALVAWLGARGIGAQLWRAAWAVPFCVALHAVQLGLSALAWRSLCGRALPGPLGWWRVRWVREAVNSLLPVGQIGGNLVGIRLLTASGISQGRAAAGTVLDLTVEACSQAAFTLAGIAVLTRVSPDRRWIPWVGGATLALCLGVAALLAAQRFGLLRWIEVASARLRRVLPALDLSGLAAAFAERRGDTAALLQAAALHMTAWLLGVGETLLGLAAMGVHPGMAVALAIESLGMAARSVGFAVPGALGVQEAGYVLVCGLFAIPADSAVALSMVKRGRELLVGTAGLLAWQRQEILLRRAVQPAPLPPRSGSIQPPEIAP